MDPKRYPLLSAIERPQEIQTYDGGKLQALADECRTFLMDTIAKSGGHIGAALGVVELTVALFNQFDFLRDRIAWDVGHQGHVHKLLTGRGPMFAEYGKWGGMCKFLERRESPYDHMGAGHASTSVSTALGMAIARDLHHADHHVLAVLGDGALTGGLAYEALYQAGSLDLNLIVVLNDNGMSIDPNVGPFARTLTRVTSSDPYVHFREEVKKVGRRVPFGSEILKSLKHFERSLKDYASPDVAALFESMGFKYFGPVPGHDLGAVRSMLKHARTMRGPILIHLLSVKGMGLGPDIENTFAAHAVSPKKSKAPDAPPTIGWSKICGAGMTELMERDPDVVAITAAMLTNTGLAPVREKYPDRVLDMGIAEQNSYCSAGGMAIEGLKPFVTIYSTFSQRAFDQMVHDIGIQNLPVRIMMDRAGFVGADGPTHHGVFDVSYLRLIPNYVQMAPRNELEMRRMILTAYEHDDGPIAMRYPRGETEAMTWEGELEPIPIGQGELLRDEPEPELVFVALGPLADRAAQVAGELADLGVPASVINARFVRPLDEALLAEQIGRARAVITVEENVVNGGFGEAVLQFMARRDLLRPTRLLGAPDAFVGYGGVPDQHRAAGLLPEQIRDTALGLWEQVTGKTPRRAEAGQARPA